MPKTHPMSADQRFRMAIVSPLALETHRSAVTRAASLRHLAELGIEHDSQGYSFHGCRYDWLEDAEDAAGSDDPLPRR